MEFEALEKPRRFECTILRFVEVLAVERSQRSPLDDSTLDDGIVQPPALCKGLDREAGACDVVSLPGRDDGARSSKSGGKFGRAAVTRVECLLGLGEPIRIEQQRHHKVEQVLADSALAVRQRAL